MPLRMFDAPYLMKLDFSWRWGHWALLKDLKQGLLFEEDGLFKGASIPYDKLRYSITSTHLLYPSVRLAETQLTGRHSLGGVVVFGHLRRWPCLAQRGGLGRVVVLLVVRNSRFADNSIGR